jgi:hypothetical protein
MAGDVIDIKTRKKISLSDSDSFEQEDTRGAHLANGLCPKCNEVLKIYLLRGNGKNRGKGRFVLIDTNGTGIMDDYGFEKKPK